MADTDFTAFDDATALQPSDILLVVRGAGGKNVFASMLAHKQADGLFHMDAGAAIAGGASFGGFVQSGTGVHVGLSGGVGVVTATAGAAYLPLLLEGSGITFRISGAPVFVIDGSYFYPSTDNTKFLGGPGNRFNTIYAGTATINTSDARDKVEVGAFPEAWLDAWADVQWQRFKFADSVAEKGDGARWHAGAIAQQVRDAFDARGLDAFAIGLCCYDAWEEASGTDELRDDAGNLIAEATPPRPAGDRWGLRYSECFALEAAYQRRRMAAIEARLEAMEGAA